MTCRRPRLDVARRAHPWPGTWCTYRRSQYERYSLAVTSDGKVGPSGVVLRPLSHCKCDNVASVGSGRVGSDRVGQSRRKNRFFLRDWPTRSDPTRPDPTEATLSHLQWERGRSTTPLGPTLPSLVTAREYRSYCDLLYVHQVPGHGWARRATSSRGRRHVKCSGRWLCSNQRRRMK